MTSTTHEQLAEVATLLATAPDDTALYELYATLTQLAQLEDAHAAAEAASTTSSSHNNSNEYLGPSSETGTHCRAPFHIGYGRMRLAHATITEHVDSDVRVFFLTPYTTKMRPCTHFLEGHCTFGDRCRYSHGHIVPRSEIQPATVTPLTLEGRCLARYAKDDLWYDAYVMAMSLDGETITVQFREYDESVIVPSSDVLPLADNDTDSDDGSDAGDEDEDYEKDAAHQLSVRVTWEPFRGTDLSSSLSSSSSSSSSPYNMGVWEQHTRGIGSRLMMRMGYTPGTALGRGRPGLIRPIEVEVLGKGRSLDFLDESRQRFGKRQMGRADQDTRQGCRRRRRRATEAAADVSVPELSVFDFLNKHLGVGSSTTVPTPPPPPPPPRTSQSTTSTPVTKSNPNVQLVELQRDIQHVRAEYLRTKESVQRHAGDKTTQDHFKSKLRQLHARHEQLQQQERQIQQRMNDRKAQRDLLRF